ncbi:MAG: class I SAM-dependent methyltransferase, partial [Gramella sp.]|nr:class I SAM-dependent methyltransferase [Christiangramia sp.]
YPAEIYDFIQRHLNDFERAWDCGTGNGQVASVLSKFFNRVEATDISENQIEHAIKNENINYSIQPAERTNFKDDQFDLIIVAQAAHWFNIDLFYTEVKRCLKPTGICVIMGYGLFYSAEKVNAIIKELYANILGVYWDPERKFLDDHYQTIPFPLNEIKTPDFYQKYTWSIEHLLGYLRTWSAVKHYQKANKTDPVILIESKLRGAFGDSNEVVFPILLRMGKTGQS